MNPPKPGPTILFAEDDDLVREIVEETLRGARYAVTAVGDGAEGLEALARGRHDLILSDARMPRCDGFELLQAVRRDPVSRWTPFIIMSAKAETADQRLGMTLGADDYLTKPCKTEDLLQSIAVRLERAAAIAALRRRTQHLLARVVPDAMREAMAEIADCADRLVCAGGSRGVEMTTCGRRLERSGQRLHAVADDLALLASLESGERVGPGQEAESAEISPERVRTWCRSCAAYHGRGDELAIDVQTAVLSLPVRGLDRVVAHLVDHAFRFSAPGSPVQVTGRRMDSGYEIAVCDRGAGGERRATNRAGGSYDPGPAMTGAEGDGLGLMLAQEFAGLSGAEFRLVRNTDGPGVRASLCIRMSRAG